MTVGIVIVDLLNKLNIFLNQFFYIYILMKRYGSRAEVMHGTAKMTTGRLLKSELIKNRQGRIVSRKKIRHMKDPKKNPLLKLGYQRKKGSKEFGPNNLDEKKNNSKKKNNNSKKKSNNYKNKSFVNKVSNIIKTIIS
jgi:hypothetical protein